MYAIHKSQETGLHRSSFHCRNRSFRGPLVGGDQGRLRPRRGAEKSRQRPPPGGLRRPERPDEPLRFADLPPTGRQNRGPARHFMGIQEPHHARLQAAQGGEVPRRDALQRRGREVQPRPDAKPQARPPQEMDRDDQERQRDRRPHGRDRAQVSLRAHPAEPGDAGRRHRQPDRHQEARQEFPAQPGRHRPVHLREMGGGRIHPLQGQPELLGRETQDRRSRIPPRPRGHDAGAPASLGPGTTGHVPAPGPARRGGQGPQARPGESAPVPGDLHRDEHAPQTIRQPDRAPGDELRHRHENHHREGDARRGAAHPRTLRADRLGL